MLKEEISFRQARKAENVIDEVFGEAKGSLGIQVFFIKDALDDTFSPYKKKARNQRKQIDQLSRKAQEEQDKDNPDRKKVNGIIEKQQDIVDDLEAMADQTEEIYSGKGYLKESDLREEGYDMVKVFDALQFAIEFEDEPENDE